MAYTKTFLALAWCAMPFMTHASRVDVIGTPMEIVVRPNKITLAGSRSLRQLVVTGRYANGERDITSHVHYEVGNPVIAAVEPGGLVVPKGNGATTIVLRAGKATTKVAVTVERFDQPDPVSFRRDVMAVLSVAGCNSGSCHGTPKGRNGFKLSLRGYDAAEDYASLRRDVLGRRTNLVDPDASLILQKALGHLPHEGGMRFAPNSRQARTLRDWLKQGGADDPATETRIRKLEIVPGPRVLTAPASRQQLAVLAHFADGTIRDVTPMTVFTSSDANIAQVSASGLVEFMQAGEVAILCRHLQTLQSIHLTYLVPREGFIWKSPPEHNFIDKQVNAKLKLLSIPPSDLCSDSEFLRRAYLDVCAVLPTPQETRRFLADKDKDKRARLVERLLQRDEFLDFWTMKWLDVLRGSEKALRRDGANVYRQWFREHLRKDTPFDAVVRELLTAKGSTFAVGPANFYRAVRTPEEMAETTAQLFLGVRMQCAKCHNHPFERWTQDDYFSLAAFFAKVSHKGGGKNPLRNKNTETIFLEPIGEVLHLRTGLPASPRFLGADTLAPVPLKSDGRAILAKWATSKSNPFFARSVVNRVWFHLMGRGIVDPVDDFRDSNPPANEALLDALARSFSAHDFDLKHLIRTIIASRTYQLSAVSNELNKSDVKYFSHATARLLSAEQILDALSQATDVAEKFDGFPPGTRAVEIAGMEIEHPFLKAFGQPARDTACECEREGETNLTQALQFINGATVNTKLTDAKNRIGRLLANKLTDREIAEELYLATLSRFPSDAEIRKALAHIATADTRRAGWEDVQWALFNSKEFLFRH